MEEPLFASVAIVFGDLEMCLEDCWIIGVLRPLDGGVVLVIGFLVIDFGMAGTLGASSGICGGMSESIIVIAETGEPMVGSLAASEVPFRSMSDTGDMGDIGEGA